MSIENATKTFRGFNPISLVFASGSWTGVDGIAPFQVKPGHRTTVQDGVDRDSCDSYTIPRTNPHPKYVLKLILGFNAVTKMAPGTPMNDSNLKPS